MGLNSGLYLSQKARLVHVCLIKISILVKLEGERRDSFLASKRGPGIRHWGAVIQRTFEWYRVL